MTLIEAMGVYRSFGDFTAVEDLDLQVAEGSIVALIGPSGCGKTTTLRMLCGTDAPTRGSVRLFGRGTAGIERAQRRRYALLAQDPALVEEFTIREQVAFAARLRRVPQTQVDEVLERVGLSDAGDTRLKNASGGMRRRTGLAATLVSDPDLVFCDEPTAGLDPILRDEIWHWFRERRRKGRAMVVTTQHIDEAARCDRVIMLRDGKVITDANPSELALEAGLSQQVVIDFPRRVSTAETVEQAVQLLLAAGYAARADGLQLVVETDDAAQAAAAIIPVLDDADIPTAAIDTVSPGLDDVFRALVEQR